MMQVTKYIIEFLISKKIKTIPVYQGGAVMNFIDEIGRHPKLNYVVPYHEQALSMQVDTMARLDGFAAGFATSGPGATNLLTGVCSAFYDSIPCFYFTGQVGQIHLKKDRGVRQLGFQETDVVEIFKPITKYATQINDASKVRYELEKGYELAISGRPGPVIFDIPFNIQRTMVNPKKLLSFKLNKKKISQLNINKINNLKKEINKAKKPLILVGGGVNRANQEKQFLQFVRKYKIPFVTTWMSQDLTSYDDELYFGSIGKNGHRSANHLTSKCDLLICIGQRFGVKNVFGEFGKKAKIIAIDIDKNELNNGLVKPHIAIEILIQDLFLKLGKNPKINRVNKSWINECKKAKENLFKILIFNKNTSERKKFISVYKFFDIISKTINKNSLIFPDAGANQVWFFQSFLQKKEQIIINHTGHSPMGHSISASIGGHYSKKSKNKKLIAFTGDGGFMMNVQELEHIKNHKIPVKIIVLDNRSLGNTKLGTLLAFNGRTHGNDKKNGYFPPNIEKISKGFGINYHEFYNGTDVKLIKKFKKFLNEKGPSIFRVHLSETQNVAELHVLTDNKKKDYFI